MSRTSRLSLIAGAALVAASSSGAWADTTVTQSDAWSHADEVRSIVAETLADAETRSSLLQAGGTAGHDGHFFLASSDGNFRLNVSGLIQFRYVLNFRDEDNSTDRNGDGVVDGIDQALDPTNDFESGFQTRRTRLAFSGHVVEPALFYFVQGDFNRNGGGFTLLDAYVGYEWENGFTLRWGQFKLPFLREKLVNAGMQLAADRSMVEAVFGQGRSQGVELSYKAENYRAAVAFSDGFRSANSDIVAQRSLVAGFLPLGAATEAQWAFTARGEVLFAGSWSQFKDFTSGPDDDFAIMVGFAGHVEGGDQDHNAFFGGDYAYASWTIDVSVEGQGWNAFAALVGGHTFLDDVPGAATISGLADVENTDVGFVVQGGMMIPDTDWEIFGRLDTLFPDGGDRRTTSDSFTTLTFGTNYYLSGHAAKFTADIVWFVDDTNQLSGANTGIAYLTDDDGNEIAIRFQFQLLF